jgi:hypothetical protein
MAMPKVIDRLQRFKKDYIDPPIMTTKEVKDNVWVYNQLRDAGFLGTGMKKLNLDSKYWACSKKEFEDWIKWDWTNAKRYVAEQYDCDNFAFSFKARCDRKIGINAVALIIDYGGGHAYNLVCFTDAPAELYEPQGDKWVKPNQSKSKTEIYKMTDGYIII